MSKFDSDRSFHCNKECDTHMFCTNIDGFKCYG